MSRSAGHRLVWGLSVASVLGAALQLALPPPVAAQECSAGTLCAKRGQAGNDYANGPAAQAFLSGGAASAAVGVYCVNKLTAEVSRVCAEEQKRMGRPDCAALAYRQAAENERVASAAKANAGALVSSSPNWKTVCKVGR